jgi:hypothetical protein
MGIKFVGYYFRSISVAGNEMSRAYSTNGEKRNAYMVLVKKARMKETIRETKT